MNDFSLSASVRTPAVAGLFYPEDADDLRATVGNLLANVDVSAALPAPPEALIVPHAGYPYSGPVAAAAYKLIEPLRDRIKRIVMVGPSHRVYLKGVAVPRVRCFATPLGEIPIDAAGRNRLLESRAVLASDTPHEFEHCLEVQLPFLQTVIGEFALLPLVVGSTPATQLASILEDFWGGEETLVIASSDLSHYHPYASAREIDAMTAKAIVAGHTDLTHDQACGAAAINGLLTVARRRALKVTEIARLNSGDTAGDLNRVVGYGAYAIHARSVTSQ
jgi:AmmeMemoRadiSam system protein B